MFVLKNAGRTLCAGALLFAVIVLSAESAEARPKFPSILKKAYPEYKDALEAKGEKINCTLCHAKNDDNKKKKFRNNYGWALKKALDHKENEKNADKVTEALKKIEGEKSHIEGKTFGDLIKEGETLHNDENIDEEVQKKKEAEEAKE